MGHEESDFTGERGLRIYWQCWLPDSPARAVLLVAHGYAEHSGRYANLVDYFVPKGYAVYAVDHRGHGRSEGNRVEVLDYDDYLRDLKTFYDLVRERQSQPLFLVGHSMGGGIAIAYAIQHQAELHGLVVSGSGITLPGRPSDLPGRMNVELADTLSRDPQVAEAYRNDPLVYLGPRPQTTVDAMRGIAERTAEGARTLTLPLLVMVGDASPLGEGPRGQDLHDTAASEVKRIHHYPDLLHEIFNEPEHREVMADMERWLEERLAS